MPTSSSGRSARSRRYLAQCAVVVAAAATLVACHGRSTPSGGGSTAASAGGAGTSASAADTVTVKNFSFEPMKVTVKTGATVTWKFEDTAQHTVQFAKPKVMSKPLANGQTFSYTFKTAGTYDYICSIHQYMTGTVVVK